MMDNFYDILVAIAAITIWIMVSYLYKLRSRDFMQTFLDAQDSITVLVKNNKITMINEAGLKIFGFDSLKALTASKSSIVEFFLEEYGCLDKHTFGQKWIEKIFTDGRNQNHKVKIHSVERDFPRYYQIKVSKLKPTKEYILNFTDITEIERDRGKLKEIAELDPLTKIYNRVRLNELFDIMFMRANKHNLNLSVILFDIDHFKQINDQYGHNMGDKVLMELARLSKGLLRKDDLIARWGGEEFIVLLDETSIEEAANLAKRLKQHIEKYPFGLEKPVTCSFGVTDLSSGDTKIMFLERVDKALYKAKDTGRNRVIMKKKPQLSTDSK